MTAIGHGHHLRSGFPPSPSARPAGRRSPARGTSRLPGGRTTIDPFASVLIAAQQGAAWALQRLWEDLGPTVAGFLRARGAPDAEDLASEVFISFCRSLPRFEGDESQLRSWLLTIAHRRLVDDRRRRGRRRTEVAQEAADRVPGGDVEEEAVGGLAGEEARRLLAHLSDDQRAVIVLRILADMPIEDVARVVGKRPGAVKALQHRALARLRAVAQHEDVSP